MGLYINMKTRSGFVSNSSSSSFIVHNNIKRVAPTMLDIVIQDWTDWPDRTKRQIAEDRIVHKTWRDNLEKALKKTSILSGKIGITLPSTNEETYIVYRNGICYVQTCRNHDWSDVEGFGANYGEDGNDNLSNIIDGSYFYDVKTNTIHSPVRYDHEATTPPICQKCGDENYGAYCLSRTGVKLCSSCGKKLSKPKPPKPPEPEVPEVKTFNSPISSLEID